MKISCLGPAGSFTELAAINYISQSSLKYDIILYPNIMKAFEAVGAETEAGIIPIENMIEGFIPLSLDLLADTKLKIIDEIMIPVKFSFAANCKSLHEVKKVYVQFAAHGQCRKFFATLNDDVQIITTDSNSSSFDEVCAGKSGEAAVIPSHMLSFRNFELSVDDITDNEKNRTRFFVLSEKPEELSAGRRQKTSIIITEAEDKPGSLYNILGSFHRRNLNLSSIISRPNKIDFGKYFFFMDIDAAYPDNIDLANAVEEIADRNKVKVLGSYPASRI
ncbi:MAG: prephenate dehydratase [Spirochaetes bacterium]|nr:prephenate dehydratase [Spirochaetota bacterium]